MMNEVDKSKMHIKQKIIKKNIRKLMKKRNIGIINLSNKSKINIFCLIILLYCPCFRIKLYKAICICKSLKVELSDIFE